MQKKIHEHITEARKAAGLTIAQVSKASGVSISRISEFETGKTGIDAEKLLSLCQIVGVSLDALTGVEPVQADRGSDIITEKINIMLADMTDAQRRDVLKYVITHVNCKNTSRI